MAHNIKTLKNFRSRWRKSDIYISVWTWSNILVATLRNHLFGPDRKRPVCSRYICTHYC